MAVLPRYLAPQVRRDLETKMVFVAGARQVGKATLARNVPGGTAGYLNWDVAEDRERLLRRELPATRLWVFDEIHKYRSWRNYLKGLYDSPARSARILVTGSARLDLYRFGGDSLQGRYHLLRLHPLSAAELGLTAPAQLLDLLRLGGFRGVDAPRARPIQSVSTCDTPPGPSGSPPGPLDSCAVAAIIPLGQPDPGV